MSKSVIGWKTQLGEYMEAEVIQEKPKTLVWTVRNRHHGTKLGEIKWYPQWRQYCFVIDVAYMYHEGTNELVFSCSCFEELNKFIATLRMKVQHQNGEK